MILGLHGKMGSGKNEAARRLALLSPIPVVEISYAAKLKQSAAAALGISVADLEYWKNDRRVHVSVTFDDQKAYPEVLVGSPHMTVRSFLQKYGTEAHRDVFGQDFWLDAALPLPEENIALCSYEEASFRFYADALYVVTDVRFPNEAERIYDLGGTTVQIVGPEKDTNGQWRPEDTHPSESLVPCDFWINNTTRDDGFASLDAQLAELLALLGV